MTHFHWHISVLCIGWNALPLHPTLPTTQARGPLPTVGNYCQLTQEECSPPPPTPKHTGLSVNTHIGQHEHNMTPLRHLAVHLRPWKQNTHVQTKLQRALHTLTHWNGPLSYWTSLFKCIESEKDEETGWESGCFLSLYSEGLTFLPFILNSMSPQK